MIMIKFYSVQAITSREERTAKTLAHFLNKKDAVRFALSPYGRDVYDKPGRISETVYEIYGSFECALDYFKNSEKETALNKLTDSEKEVLGLQNQTRNAEILGL